MAGSDDVKLLGARQSPPVNRVQFALNLKSVDYEFLIENFPAKSELLLKSNPVHKKIPVLIHGGDHKPICESLVIVQYIDEIWSDGPSILPSDPYDRAIARFWAAYIDDKWFPLFKELNVAKEESKAAVLEKILEGLTLLEDVFVKSSNGKGFFGGETIGYLDIVLGCYLGWVKAVDILFNVKILDETKFPAIVEWVERFCSDKAVKGTLPETEEILNIYKMRMSSQYAAARAEATK